MEDRSRRNNVGLDGFPQVNENTWYKFEEQVQEVFSEKVRSENSKIERADRTKRNKNNKAVTQEPFADYRITKKRSLCHETGRN